MEINFDRNRSIIELLKMPFPFDISFGQIIKANKILVIAPHPDDEILGCGGTLFHYNAMNTKILIVYLTDGRYGSENQNIEVRKKEAESIKQFLPKIEQIFLDFADSNLYNEFKSVQFKLKEIIYDFKPELIFSPWMIDRHSDHEATTAILAEALKDLEQEVLISLYEIMLPLVSNHSVNITMYVKQKHLLLCKYASQMKRYNLANVSTSLNQYRATIIRRKSIEAAEAFSVMSKHDLIELISKLFYTNNKISL